MTPLYLLRHGPTLASAQGAPLGRLDLPVTAHGDEQWPFVRAYLMGLGLEQVWTSPLRRARMHAESLGLPTKVSGALAEQDFGAWDGIPWTDIQGAERWFANPANEAAPGGESFARCAERAVGELAADWPQKPTLILAHAGPLRGIFAWLMGMSVERALDLRWDPFGLTCFELVERGRGVAVFHNLSLPARGPTPVTLA